MADLVAAGLLESHPAITEITGTTAKINCVFKTLENGSWQVRFGTDPTLTTYNVTTQDVFAETTLGEVKTAAISGLTAGTTYYYRVTITDISHSLTLSDIFSFATTRAYTQAVDYVIGGDGHIHQKILEEASGAGLTLLRNCMDNIAAATGSRFIDVGDTTQFVKYNTNHAAVFPINAAGVSVNPTSVYALSQQDCDYISRLDRQHFKTALCGKMLIKATGNHDGEQWWHKSANNGGANDVSTYSRTSFNSFFGNSLAAIALSGANADGRWGAWRDGSAMFCILDPYIDTRPPPPSTTVVDLTAPDNVNYWCLDQTQWDYFFHATTGWVTKASPTYDAGNPSYTGVQWIVFCIHNLCGGEDGPSHKYGRGGKQYVVTKTQNAACSEWGASASWTNPRGWTGDHASLGEHKAIVARCNANGCIPMVFMGHEHFSAVEWVDGVPYIHVPQYGGKTASPYDYGFKDETEFEDTDLNTVYRPNAGHINLHCESDFATVSYIRSYVGSLGVADPDDGRTVNGDTVDSFTLYATTAMQAEEVIDSGDRTPEDTATISTAGTENTAYPNAGEPNKLTTMYGAYWKCMNNDPNATASRRVNLAVRTSPIDGLKVIMTRPPYSVTETEVRQSALIKLDGSINRRIKVQFRQQSASGRSHIHIPICGNDAVTWLTTVNNKGLYLRYVHGDTGSMGLYWDDGTTDALATNNLPVTAAYTCPAATSFDSGITIELVGRNIGVFGPTGTRIIYGHLTQAIYDAITTGETYRGVGMAAGSMNASFNNLQYEFRQFHAKTLGSIKAKVNYPDSLAMAG